MSPLQSWQPNERASVKPGAIHRYLSMDLLTEHKRELLRQLEEAA